MSRQIWNKRGTHAHTCMREGEGRVITSQNRRFCGARQGLETVPNRTKNMTADK